MSPISTLFSFNNDDGAQPLGGLVIGPNGDLYGTTSEGGANGDNGTVFELTNAGGSYTLTTLVNFDNTDGSKPSGSLVFDRDGNLFGTTAEGGTIGYGTVFQLFKTGSGYAADPATLVSFNGTNGQEPSDNLYINSGGLIGTTSTGGTSDAGTVFVLEKFTLGRFGYFYALLPVLNFDGVNGGLPSGGLTADANASLFGTTQQGGDGFGTVFQFAAPPTDNSVQV